MRFVLIETCEKKSETEMLHIHNFENLWKENEKTNFTFQNKQHMYERNLHVLYIRKNNWDGNQATKQRSKICYLIHIAA